MTKIVLLGEARGANEEHIQSSFVGASGIELLKMLGEAGVITLTSADFSYISRFYDKADPLQIDMAWRLHPEVHRANVFNFHPLGNEVDSLCGLREAGIPGYPALLKGKKAGYVRASYATELERLADEILAHDPNLIICLGNTALWALTGSTGVSKLRGTTCVSTHTVGGYKCLPAYHPAAVLRQWDLRPVTIIDFGKAKREAEFPDVRRPKCEIWIEPTIGDIDEFIRTHVIGCEILSVDIETAGNRITCIGFAPSKSIAVVIPFDDERTKGGSYWPDAATEAQVWALLRRVIEDQGIKKVFQNGLYDIAFLARSYGILTRGAEHDTMLLQHALQPEALKGLGFLGSIYTDHGPWKHERKGTTTIKRDE